MLLSKEKFKAHFWTLPYSCSRHCCDGRWGVGVRVSPSQWGNKAEWGGNVPETKWRE